MDNRDGFADSVDFTRPLSEEEAAFLAVLQSQAAPNPSLSGDVPSGSSLRLSPDSSLSAGGSVPTEVLNSESSPPSSLDPITQSDLSKLEERLMEYFDSCFLEGDGSDSENSEPEDSGEGVRLGQSSSAAAIQRERFMEEFDFKLSSLPRSKFSLALRELLFRGPISASSDGWGSRDCWDFVWPLSERKKILKSNPPLEAFNPKHLRHRQEDWALTPKSERDFDSTLKSILEKILISFRICASWGLDSSFGDDIPPKFAELVRSLRYCIASVNEARLLLISSSSAKKIVSDAKDEKSVPLLSTRLEDFIEAEHKKRKHIEKYFPSRKKTKFSGSGSGGSSGSSGFRPKKGKSGHIRNGGQGGKKGSSFNRRGGGRKNGDKVSTAPSASGSKSFSPSGKGQGKGE